MLKKRILGSVSLGTGVSKMDTLNYVMGAVLTQEVEGIERLIAYASRKFNPPERRYATIEWECLVIKWGV
ncbi:hypothetical protein Y1Q_0016144 [Alligator mississippiensis]|uniref:Reverse transcriptase RNase H-like domain-containing protein n=1 Tax=Alligator mississippiensis TaxID=8496 RepID=A0A151P0V2_ALLMI|nr:hypothetical protein Y1Q_0016144 [Alligator mississippiensis]